MIRLMRAAERRYVRNGALSMWKSFDPDLASEPLQGGFRSLEALNEVSLPPGASFNLNLDQEHDLVTYVRRGGILVRAGSQGADLLGPGCFQRASSRALMTARVPESSPAGSAHLFLSAMRVPSSEAESAGEVRRFSFADRHGRLRLVAAPRGGAGLRLYSSVLDKGCHVVHPLPADRGAWLQMVAGRVRLLDQSVEIGDGAAFEGEAAVSFTTQEASEILLFELA